VAFEFKTENIMQYRIIVTLKKGVLDPQGNAACNALHHLGFEEARSVRIGKVIDLDIDPSEEADALERITQMCEKLLANTVIEDYSIHKQDS
jgi:phosphoribosylformylglycinamidine synthase PurS subunit